MGVDLSNSVGKHYVGPETNYIPHEIIRVGWMSQDTASGIQEGWLCYELEGGTVIGMEDPATRSPERREIV